jgi:hypothetical protein
MFLMSDMSLHVFTNNAGHLVKHAVLGDYVKDKVPSLKPFMSKGNADQDYNIPSLAALSSAMRLLQRFSDCTPSIDSIDLNDNCNIGLALVR